MTEGDSTEEMTGALHNDDISIMTHRGKCFIRRYSSLLHTRVYTGRHHHPTVTQEY